MNFVSPKPNPEKPAAGRPVRTGEPAPPSLSGRWRMHAESMLGRLPSMPESRELQNDLLSLHLQHMIGLAPRTAAASRALFLKQELLSRDGTLSEEGARLAKDLAEERHLGVDSLCLVARRMAGMDLEPAWHELLLRTFCEPEEGLQNLLDKFSILEAGVAGLPPRQGGRRGDGVLLYPGAHLDIEHAILLPARTYYLMDPLYGHPEVLGSLVEKLIRYCDPQDLPAHQIGSDTTRDVRPPAPVERPQDLPAHQIGSDTTRDVRPPAPVERPQDLQVHQIGSDTLVLLPGRRFYFVLTPRCFDGMASEKFPTYSAFVFKKPNGSLLAHAGHLADCVERLRVGGFLLYADLARLGENADALDSSAALHRASEGMLSCCTEEEMEAKPMPDLHRASEGMLSCCRVLADGLMEDYPFVLWAKS